VLARALVTRRTQIAGVILGEAVASCLLACGLVARGTSGPPPEE
jgi:hypothetical protein